MDAEAAETLLGATVAVLQNDSLLSGTTTDLDGLYELQLEPGSYQLIISYVAYVPDTIDILAVAGAVVYNETVLYQGGTLLEEVVVSATAVQTTDLAINLAKQNSINTIDGISISQIQRTGDNNLAGALQRVTGVSVEGGRYVTVRGLGDRYSKTLLNGGEIPALDPERNTTQLDIFPSTLIDNVIVFKNFTPDLPGSFTGGLVNIHTKSHPEDFQVNFSTRFSYNPTANLRNDFLTHQGGKTDYLGFDDGTRAIPDLVSEIEKGYRLSDTETINTVPSVRGSTTDSVRAALADQVARSFPPFYTIQNKTSGINQTYQLSFGNQHNLGNRPLGYVVGISYRNASQYNEDLRLGRYELAEADSVVERRYLSGVLTEEEVLWGAVAGLSFKPSSTQKYTFTYMHNQSGINQTRAQAGTDLFDLGGPGDSLVDRGQSYIQRSLDAFQLRGEHVFGKLEIDWIGSYTRSSDVQPDFRLNQFSSLQREELRFDSDGNVVLDSMGQPVFDRVRIYDYQQSVHLSPQRYYRNLQEVNQDIKLNFALPVKVWANQEAKIKFGGAYTYKDRSFREKLYNINVNRGIFNEPDYGFRNTGDLTKAFATSNFGIQNVTQRGDLTEYVFVFSYDEGSRPSNTYFADQTVYAGYSMVELPLGQRLRLIGGVRYETTDINLRTLPDDSGFFATGKLDEKDLLPAGHLIYKITKAMNLRTGYARTLARPSFREIAPYNNFAFIGDFTFTGNPNLKRTLVDNYDLRYEWFPTPGELVSVSGFYKLLYNPIERGFGRFSQTDQTDIFIYNVDKGTAYGFEVEIQKNFGFIAPALEPLRIGANFSYIESVVDLDSTTRQVAQRLTGTTTHPLFGQPDYTFNAEIAYIDNERLGVQASVSYTVFGQRLTLVGGANFNVYEQPRGLLNASLRKTIGRHFAIQLRGENLLDPAYRQIYRVREKSGRQALFENYHIGRTYSLGFAYNL
jgi:TonB-dependent receptor